MDNDVNLMALGEFGRTPKISTLSGQSKAGRDHWANAMSVLFAGGKTPGGQAILIVPLPSCRFASYSVTLQPMSANGKVKSTSSSIVPSVLTVIAPAWISSGGNPARSA